MKTNYEVIAVGAWVETINNDIADLCNCEADAIGQRHLRDYSEDVQIAERIALLWNLFRGISNDDVEKVVGIVDMLEERAAVQ